MTMDVIKTYLDNVFAAYPQTGELQKLRRDMLANMEEKYVMLRQGGKSEHEAAYGVIADFGNMEELTAELGLETKDKKIEETTFLPCNDAQTYLAMSRQSGVLVGFGVWLILAGVSTVIFLNGSVILLFPAIAIAVALFIVNGNRMSEYESYEETPLRMDSITHEIITKERAAFMPRSTVMIAGGVAFIILGAGGIASINLPVSIFLNIIGFSVFLFIFAGTYSSAFDVLLGKGDYSNKIAEKKVGRIIGTIAAIYWPIVSAIGLWQLFIGNSYFWLSWVIGGVLFGGISGGLAVWFGTKEE